MVNWFAAAKKFSADAYVVNSRTLTQYRVGTDLATTINRKLRQYNVLKHVT